jgi:hypothetical protein
MLSVLLPPEGRGALLAGSFTRFWRFTIEQPSRLFLSLAGFRACLLAGRRQRQCGLLFVALVFKERLSISALVLCACYEAQVCLH